MSPNTTMRTIRSLLNCVKGSTLIFSVLIFAFASTALVKGQSTAGTEKTFTVVIDAGHGGKDPGAVGKMSKEKDIALSIAKKTGTYISSLMPDVRVIYTRTKDEFIDLNVRANIAIDNKADLFLSIHVNGNNKPSVYGAETYVMGPSKSEGNLALAQKENSVILLEENNEANYEGFNPNDPSSYIMFSVMQNIFLNQSLNMASEVQDQLRIRAQRKDGGVRQGPFLVLWKTTMPSVLVETGYITNKEEEKYLTTDYGQDVIASAIYRAFSNYKAETQQKTAKIGTGEGEGKDQIIAKEALSELKEEVKQTRTESETTVEEPGKAVSTTQAATKTENKEVKSADSSSDELVFRVQVIASQSRIPAGSSHFKGENNLKEIQMDGYYKYMTTPVSTYSQSQDLRKKLSAKFPGAFIVAFLKGNKIPLPEAISLDNKKQ